MLVQLEQIPGAPLHGQRVAGREQTAEHRQVVLEVVHRSRGCLGGRPRERRPRLPRRRVLQLLVAWHAARDRAHHIEAVEGRHPRTCLAQLDARIRQVHALGRRAHGEVQQQALVRRALARGLQATRYLAANSIGQQGVFTQFLRKQALRQAGDEDDAEDAAAGFFGGADEHAAVAARRRLDGDRSQPIRQHLANLAQRDRADGRHRTQFREHALHHERLTNHARHQRLEAVEPLAPRAVLGPRGELIDQRQRERTQVLEIRQVALDSAHAG